MSGINSPYTYQYEHVPASATARVLGGNGAIGDYIHRLACTVATAATGSVSILDGTGFTHVLLPASPGGGIGQYDIELNIVSRNGPWKITTGAGVEVLAIGIFSA